MQGMNTQSQHHRGCVTMRLVTIELLLSFILANIRHNVVKQILLRKQKHILCIELDAGTREMHNGDVHISLYDVLDN